jgi:hypothetical protein
VDIKVSSASNGFSVSSSRHSTLVFPQHLFPIPRLCSNNTFHSVNLIFSALVTRIYSSRLGNMGALPDEHLEVVFSQVWGSTTTNHRDEINFPSYLQHWSWSGSGSHSVRVSHSGTGVFTITVYESQRHIDDQRLSFSHFSRITASRSIFFCETRHNGSSATHTQLIQHRGRIMVVRLSVFSVFGFRFRFFPTIINIEGVKTKVSVELWLKTSLVLRIDYTNNRQQHHHSPQH